MSSISASSASSKSTTSKSSSSSFSSSSTSTSLSLSGSRSVHGSVDQADERNSLQEEQRIEEISLLKTELAVSQIKHEKEISRLRLDHDILRRDKEVVEDRLAEILRGLKKVEEDIVDPHELPVCIDGPYVVQLQVGFNKAIRTVEIVNKQMEMVKSRCNEVVESLEEELKYAMDEKCRMESELITQLATMQNDKRQMELAFADNLRSKEREISDIRKRLYTGSDDDESQDRFTNEDLGQLLQQIENLRMANGKMAQELIAAKAGEDEGRTKKDPLSEEKEGPPPFITY